MALLNLPRSRELILALVSLALLIVVSFATNPLSNVAYVLVFLFLLFIFLSNAGLLLAGRRGGVSRATRSKGNIGAFAIVAIIMLRSLQSFGWVDGLLVAGLVLVMFFYLGRAQN